MKKLYFNADIITMNDDKKFAQAVYVEDGKIIEVGTNEQLSKYKVDGVELIDVNNKTLMPAFIDPHSHFGGACQTTAFASLASSPVGNVSCIDDIVSELKKVADKITDERPIIGMGYDNYLLKENRHPNKYDLDKVSTTRPVIAVHASAHLAVLNQVALDTVFEYNENTPDPVGGKIGRLEGSNEPNGYVEETALTNNLLKLLGSPNPDELKNLLLKGQEMYASQGITTVQDGLTTDQLLGLIMFGEKENLLYLDVHCYPNAADLEFGKQLGINVNEKIGHVKYSGRKIILDGSIQGRTGWLKEPYEKVEESDDPKYLGYPTLTDEEVIKGIETSIKENTQVLIHTNGDAAAQQMIDCYRKAINNVKPQKDLRPVMIHAQMATAKNLEEMKELGIMPSFFAAHPFYWGDVHRLNVGEKRAAAMSNAKKAIELGMKYTTHEDTPVIPPCPLISMWVMVNRLTRSNHVLGEDMKISAYDALKATTINAAYQYFEEDIKGSIEVGKYADFVITDRNMLKVDSVEIKDIVVLETIKQGTTIYKR